MMDDASNKTDLATVETDASPARDITDESLAVTAFNGDEEAFNRIFERHKLRIARIVGRFFNRPERVEEIVQDVFTKLYFALGRFSSERGKSFASWLSSIAINSCYDELRRIRRRPESSLSDVTNEEKLWLGAQLRDGGSSIDAESLVIARDLAGKLLSRLQPDDRVILTLLDAEGLSVSDIAKLMDWSESKVKVRAHRARAALRLVLDEFV